jgi:hypothetical protein
MIMSQKDFAKGVERLVNPIEVGTIHFVQQLNGLLPRPIQNRIMRASGKKFPNMGFVVEPYSFFLFYEVKDMDRVQSMLPEGFRLIKTKVFDTDEPKYYVIFGAFRSHTSAFWGSRLEFYAVAEDEATGMLTWIILDYDTNTIGYDKKNGLRSPNSEGAVITINHRGVVYVDFKNDNRSRSLVFEGDIEEGKMRALDQRLWLEGNLSVVYGKELEGSQEDVFSLKFEPCEVEKALDIPLDMVNVDVNTWFSGMFEEKPSVALCFPYAQHFVSDSPGVSSKIKDRGELVSRVKGLDFSKIEVFNTDAMKVMFILNMILSFLITLTLVILLVVKW